MGTGISSDTRLPAAADPIDNPFVLPPENMVLAIFCMGCCVEFSEDTTSACKFFISVTDRKLSDNPSLDASDIERGDV